MRYLFTALLLTAVSYSSNAQILIGVKGGLNVSSLGQSAEYKPRIGYNAGFFYSQHLEDQYGWQFEVQYSLQGARNAVFQSVRLSYHYLAIPIVLKLYFKESVYAEVGPQVSYLLGAKSIDRDLGTKQDPSGNVRNWDLLGLLGFGYETDSGTSMGLRFGVGFLNTSGAPVGNDVGSRNLIFQAHVGIKLKDINY